MVEELRAVLRAETPEELRAPEREWPYLLGRVAGLVAFGAKAKKKKNGGLPERLREIRAERGLTLRDAELLVGVSKNALSEIERGARRPHEVTLGKIAKGYGVPVEELLGDAC